jgi:enoyl-CoA hydratase
MSASIEAHLDRAEAEDQVRVIIITAVPPVFCAGSDLNSVRERGADGIWTERGGYAGIARRERAKPLIAAVDGPSYGGGTEIVLACDLVVASRTASFALPEVRLGLVPAAGGLFRLGRKLPVNIAMWAALTGNPIDAETAHAHGLVNTLSEPGQALVIAVALAQEIAANPPVAVTESRAVVSEVTGPDDELAWARTDLAVQRTMATDAAKEGIAAFLERRMTFPNAG